MSFSPPTDPSVCYSLSQFGFGPFPLPGDEASSCPLWEPGNGFGGVSFDQDGYTHGSPYGTGSLGSGSFSAVPVFMDGGYGQSPYGQSPYGTHDITLPSFFVQSVTPWTVLVTFSELVDPLSGADDVSSYTLTALLGGPSSVESVSIVQSGDGVSSVVLTHSGLALGGLYRLVTSLSTLSGNPITGPVSFLAVGAPPNYVVSSTDGETLVLTFDGELVDNASLGSYLSYGFISDPDYPVEMVADSVSYEISDEETTVTVSVNGQTSLSYRGQVAPSTAIEWSGSYLPSESGAEEIGVGVSQVVGNYLVLSKPVGSSSYGWKWFDTSGKLQPNSCVKVDFSLDFSSASFSPPLSSFESSVTVFDLVLEDGETLVFVSFVYNDGQRFVHLVSGSYSDSVAFNWSSAPFVCSVLRNEAAGFHSLLVDGSPILTVLSSNLDGPTENSQLSAVITNSSLQVSGVVASDLLLTASQTVYSVPLNFLHNHLSAPFVGSDDLTVDSFFVANGPLVKEWGDQTLADPQDVVVRVDGTEVEIEDVNPLTGQVTLAVPVPTTSNVEVTVDYKWLPSPVVGPLSLNTDGAVLNKWDHTAQNDVTDYGYEFDYDGSANDQSRFRYAVVIGPVDSNPNPVPYATGKRHRALVNAESSLLNDPTAMLLNSSPGGAPTPWMEYSPSTTTVSFDVDQTVGWETVGSGSITTNSGVSVFSSSVGYPTNEQPPKFVFCKSPISNEPSSTITMVARYVVTDYVSHGVFSGVGFGFHNNKKLYFVGNLEIRGCQHVGVLINPSRPDLTESWSVGPGVSGTIVDKNRILVPNSQSLPAVISGRFQIFDPDLQSGVYSIASVRLVKRTKYQLYKHGVQYAAGQFVSFNQSGFQCVVDTTEPPPNDYYWRPVPYTTDDLIEITTVEEFPYQSDKWGTKYPTICFETRWGDDPITYRLVSAYDRPSWSYKVSLSLSGSQTSLLVSKLDQFSVDLPQPSEFGISPFVDFVESSPESGQALIGSFSYDASSVVAWSFAQCTVTPDFSLLSSHSRTTELLVSDVDQSTWFQSSLYGRYKENQDRLDTWSSVQSDFFPFDYYVKTTEPYLVADTQVETSFAFSIGVFNNGTPFSFFINDSTRQTEVAAILFSTSGQTNSVIRLGSVSFYGVVDILDQDWSLAQINDKKFTVKDSFASVPVGLFGRCKANLEVVSPDSGNRFVNFSLLASNFVLDEDGNSGVFLSFDFGVGATHAAVVTFREESGQKVVSVCTPSFAVLQSYAFEWDDGVEHHFVAVVSSGVLSLSIDGSLLSPSVPVSGLSGLGSGTHRVMFGSIQSGANGTAMFGYCGYSQYVASAKSTVGVYLGGDRDNINSWAIPRLNRDFSVQNSDSDSDIVEVDVFSPVSAKVMKTEWGTMVFFPDLGTPPWYHEEFANYNSEPSAAWISVEYVNIPYTPSQFGWFGFGSVNKSIFSASVFSYVTTVFSLNAENQSGYNHMVLNKAEVTYSGDFSLDDTTKIFSVVPTSSSAVSLADSDIRAEFVHKVVDGNTIFSPDQYTFDVLSQIVVLASGQSFSGQVVVVVFSPDHRFSTTYLAQIPIERSFALLYDNVPTFAQTQSQDPEFVTTEFGNHEFAQYVHGPESLYSLLEQVNVDNGGHLGLLSIVDDTNSSIPTTWTDQGGDPVYDDQYQETGETTGSVSGQNTVSVSGYFDIHSPVVSDSISWLVLDSNVVYPVSESRVNGLIVMSGGNFVTDTEDGRFASGNVLNDKFFSFVKK